MCAAGVFTNVLADGHARIRPGDALRADIEALFVLAGELLDSGRLRGEDACQHLRAGYRPIGLEYARTPDQPDLMESVSLSLRQIFELPAHECRETLLHARMRSAAGEFLQLSRCVLEEADRHYGGGGIARLRYVGASFLQVSMYHPSTAGREILQEEHEDANLLTLATSTAPGLEIREGNGYHPAGLEPGELLLMPSDIFSVLSGGEVQPLYHQVRRCPEVERRVSVLFFAAPDPDQEIRPWVCRDGEAVDLSARILNNPVQFGLPRLRV